MRVSVIFGLNSSQKDLQAFEKVSDIHWLPEIPTSKNDADAIVLFGGDGTIHRYLPRLVELQLPLLIVPRGSGNDFARALGLRSLKKSLHAWRRFVSGAGNVKDVDVGVVRSRAAQNDSAIREHLFCTVAGVGVDGEIARMANRLPRWLRANGGYALTLVPSVIRFAAVPMKISSGDSDPTGFRPVIQASFANVPAYGGGMKVAPRALMDDGQLDVCLIRDINKLKLFCVFPTIYFGRHLGVSEVEYLQTPQARLETEHPFDVYADGEYICKTPIEVSLKTKALRVVVS